MIKFTFKRSKKMIFWKCKWDGKHNEKWYKEEVDMGELLPSHPFQHTQAFKDNVGVKEWLQKQLDSQNVEGYVAPVESGLSKLLHSPTTQEEVDSYDLDKLRVIEDCCADNSATRALCKLLADKKNVHKHSGNSVPYQYWCMLLGALDSLWD